MKLMVNPVVLIHFRTFRPLFHNVWTDIFFVKLKNTNLNKKNTVFWQQGSITLSFFKRKVHTTCQSCLIRCFKIRVFFSFEFLQHKERYLSTPVFNHNFKMKAKVQVLKCVDELRSFYRSTARWNKNNELFQQVLEAFFTSPKLRSFLIRDAGP